MSSSTAPPRTSAASAIGIAVVFLAVTAIVFLLVWFALPNNHNLALAIIGILALLFAVASYFGRAISEAGGALRTLAFGYAGLGFVLLIGSIVLSGPAIGIIFELIALLFVVILIAITGAFVVWGYGARLSTAQREAHRDAWRGTAPRSAFDYTTARPSVPPSGNDPASASPPPPPPGVSR